MRMPLYAACFAALILPAHTAAAEFDVPATGVAFLSGDSWTINGTIYRLFGVQSCLRSTYVTNPAGQKLDCGMISLSLLAAILKDAPTHCTPLGPQVTNPVVVVCSSQVGKSRLDLGTMLTSQGYAFAAFGNDAKALYMPYAIAEARARENRSGLWAFPDLPYPNRILRR